MRGEHHGVHDEVGYMTATNSDIELLEKLESGAHVKYNGDDGRSHTGIVMGGPRPSHSGPTVHIKCDHRREMTTVQWTNVTGIEEQ